MIGKLRHRIAIQKSTESTNAIGEITDSWATVETVYGSAVQISGGEQRAAERNGLNVTHKITMRYRNDIGTDNTEVLSGYRLLIKGVAYDIRSVNNMELRDKFVVAMCEARI